MWWFSWGQARLQAPLCFQESSKTSTPANMVLTSTAPQMHFSLLFLGMLNKFSRTDQAILKTYRYTN